jgi:hypothetical protein
MHTVTALVISWVLWVGTAKLSINAGLGSSLLLPLVLLSAGWAARDANDIGLMWRRTLLALPPAVLFVVVALFWPLTFPWYLVTRAKVRAGTLPRREHAPSTNGFAPVTPVGALSSTAAGGDGQGSAVLVEQAADEGDEGVIERRSPRESWTAVGRVLGVLLALLCTGFVGDACAIDSLFEPVEVVAIRDDGVVGIVPVSGRWVTTSLPDRWSPIASAVEFYAACRNPEFEASCRQHGLYRAGDSSMNARHPYGAHDQNLTFSGSRVRYNEWAGKDGGISADEYDVIGRQVRPLRHNRLNVMTAFVLLPGLPFMLWISVKLLRPLLGGLAGLLYDRRQRDEWRCARLGICRRGGCHSCRRRSGRQGVR